MDDLHADLVECLGLVDRATPGEWTTDGDETLPNGNYAGTYIAKLDSGRLGQTFANCLASDDVAKINAQAIAAALNLLRTHRDELLGVVEGWRPIDELRSAAVVVLFHIPGKSLPVMARADDYHSGFAHWLEGTTHWRPLPAPPAIDAARHGRGE